MKNNDIVALNAREDADLQKSIILFFLGELAHINLLHCVDLTIRYSAHLVDLRVCTLACNSQILFLMVDLPIS
jgi:hypothetical protein